MRRHVPVCRPNGRKFFGLLVLLAYLLTLAGEVSGKSSLEHLNYRNPYVLPVAPIPEGSEIEHFFGTWGVLDSQRRGITGAMTIGPKRIKHANYDPIFDQFYKVLLVTSEYAVLVVYYKNPVRVGFITRFELLTLRRDPKDGELLLLVGRRNDFRLNREPLTRPLEFYRRLLDDPNERVLPPYSGPWGQWAFSVYEPYKK